MLQVSMISFCVVKGMLGKGNLSRPLSMEYPCPLRTPVLCRLLSTGHHALNIQMSFPWLSMLPLTPFKSLVLRHFMIATTGNWLSLWCLASLCISLKVSPLQSPCSYFTAKRSGLDFSPVALLPVVFSPKERAWLVTQQGLSSGHYWEFLPQSKYST